MEQRRHLPDQIGRLGDHVVWRIHGAGVILQGADGPDEPAVVGTAFGGRNGGVEPATSVLLKRVTGHPGHATSAALPASVRNGRHAVISPASMHARSTVTVRTRAHSGARRNPRFTARRTWPKSLVRRALYGCMCTSRRGFKREMSRDCWRQYFRIPPAPWR